MQAVAQGHNGAHDAGAGVVQQQVVQPQQRGGELDDGVHRFSRFAAVDVLQRTRVLDGLRPGAIVRDLDLKKPLDQRMAKLDALNVTFHAKLGTQGERVARIRELARVLAPIVGADAALVDRAVVLAKADLRTEAVGEFPELQGAMGRKYAALQGEDASVAAAIEDHWKPNGPSDRLPADKVGLTVALADKLDTPAGELSHGQKQWLEIGALLIQDPDLMLLDEPLAQIIRKSLEQHGLADQLEALGVNNAAEVRYAAASGVGPAVAYVDEDGSFLLQQTSDLLSFFHDRLKVYLRDQGARHDIIDAVLTPDADDLLMVARRAEALTAFITSEDGLNLLAGTKRATQLLAAEEKKGTVVADSVSADLLKLDAEKALFAAVTEATKAAAEAVSKEDFRAAMQALSALRAPVDTFFEDVLVNDEDAAIRANRLALLKASREATGTVADFSRITG